MENKIISPFVFYESNSLVKAYRVDSGNNSIIIMGRSPAKAFIDCRDEAISIAGRYFLDYVNKGHDFEYALGSFVGEWKQYVKDFYRLNPRDLFHGGYDNIRNEVEPDSFLIIIKLNNKIVVVEYGNAYTQIVNKSASALPIMRTTDYGFSYKGGNVFRYYYVSLDYANELPMLFAFSEKPCDKKFEDDYIYYIDSSVKHGISDNDLTEFNHNLTKYIESYCNSLRFDIRRDDRLIAKHYGYWFGVISLFSITPNSKKSVYKGAVQQPSSGQRSPAQGIENKQKSIAKNTFNRNRMIDKRTRLLSDIQALQLKADDVNKELIQINNQIDYINKQHEKQLDSYNKKKEMYDKFDVYDDDSVMGGAI